MRLAVFTVAASLIAAALASMTGYAVGAPADETKSLFAKEFQTARHFQNALKDNDRKTVARLVSYPIVRDYPMPVIKSPDEFIANWDEFFDEANRAEIIKNAPVEMGWRGVMLGNGLIWFDGARVIVTNLSTKISQQKFQDAKNKEFMTLHASVRGYKRVAVQCDTRSKHIRIQEHGDGYRYIVWPRGVSLSQKPELELAGSMEFDGSGGNAIYTFRNQGFRYEFYSVHICGSDCDDTLTVFKGEKQIARHVCK